MTGIGQDLRLALRLLLKRPAFAGLLVAILGIGIAANTSLFAVVDATLLRPLPYPHADRLVALATAERTNPSRRQGVTGGDFTGWRRMNRSFERLAAVRSERFNLSGSGTPEPIDGATVTDDFFPMLGVRPLRGRLFDGTDRQVAGARPAVIGEGLWKQHFGGAPDIVGREVRVNGETFIVVGVVPASVNLPPQTELWIPSRRSIPEYPLRPELDTSNDFGRHYFDAYGRLRADVPLERAQKEMASIGAELSRRNSADQPTSTVLLDPLREQLYGHLRPTLAILGAAVVFILLIGCANVANLLLARALDRRHEVAIRIALGASRGRLVRLFFLESLVVAMAGAVLGVLLSLWAAPALVALAPSQLQVEEVTVGARALGIAAGLAIATALLFGVAPVLTALPSGEALKQGGRALSSDRPRNRLRSAFVVAQVALSLTLLVGAGLMLRSFWRVRGVQPGFTLDHVMTADLSLPAVRYPDERAQSAFFEQVITRLASLPGVESAAVVSRLPLSGGNSTRSINIPGRPELALEPEYRVASTQFFRTLGIPLLAGRDFTLVDERVVIVNQSFARAAFGSPEAALGKSVAVDGEGPASPIIGVVGDIHHVGLDEPARQQMYVPIRSAPWPNMSIVVRSGVAPASLGPAMQREVAAIDRDQSLARLSTMEERLAHWLAARRFGALLLGLLAAVALALALAGIYGVMAYAVGQRVREIAIRLALGAYAPAVLARLVGQGMSLVGLGVAIGLAGALVLGRLLAGHLFGVGASDPITFVALSGLLLLTAVVSIVLAARRVLRVDPMTALRGE